MLNDDVTVTDAGVSLGRDGRARLAPSGSGDGIGIDESASVEVIPDVPSRVRVPDDASYRYLRAYCRFTGEDEEALVAQAVADEAPEDVVVRKGDSWKRYEDTFEEFRASLALYL